MSTQINGGSFTGHAYGHLNSNYFRNFWFSASGPTIQFSGLNSTTGSILYKDRMFSSGSSTNVTNFRWPYSYELDRETIQSITRSSSNSGILYPDSNDTSLWNYSGTGNVILTLSCINETIHSSVTATSQTNVIATFTGLVSGSAAQLSKSFVDAKISGLSANSNTMNIWSLRDDSFPSYVWNTGCWANGIDMTCISPWNDNAGNEKGGTLISPRHIAMANHFYIPVGSAIRYIKPDGTTITKTISAIQYAIDDIMIGILDSDVPSGINFCKVLPANFTGQLPIPTSFDDSHPWPVPILGTNQGKQAFVTNAYWASAGAAVIKRPSTPIELAFNIDVIGGDSGSPSFFIINGKLVLYTLWHFATAGPDYSEYISQVNSAMHTLSTTVGALTDYQLSTVDLSGFPSY